MQIKKLFLFLAVFSLLSSGAMSSIPAFADSDDDQHDGKVNKKNRVWTGDGPPLPKLGKVGDLYIDNHNDTYNIYKKTGKNTWTDVPNIQGAGTSGPQGETGPAGPQGETGPDGAQGMPGNNGFTTLIVTLLEPTGVNCPNGGVKIMMGIDDDNNNSLSIPSEVDSTNYVCNGISGSGSLSANILSLISFFDTDGDGIPNGSDPDVDGDSIFNGSDPDVDGDGFLNGDPISNFHDPDVDGDGIPNGIDNDVDGDGLVNTFDFDIDGDGILNAVDNDADGDGYGFTSDFDDDADQRPTSINGMALDGDPHGP